MKIGFIGAGRMASALAVGIAKSDIKVEIHAFDPSQKAILNFEESVDGAGGHIKKCASNQAVIEQCEFVFVAVKPQVLRTALDGIESQKADCVFVSVIAGTKIETLTKLLDSKRIVRTMPNTPCLIGKGAIAVSGSDAVTVEELDKIKTLLSAVGVVVEVAENLLDAVTGLSGSGPAFVYTFLEALIDAGVLAGLPRDIAKTLAVQTAEGSVQMLLDSDSHPALLRDKVTSPGGTTIHGMEKLEQLGFRESILAAVRAATERSKELSTN